MTSKIRRKKKVRSYRDNLVEYFAYGSNLLASRLKARVRYAEFVEIGKLTGYTLTFNFLAAGSGKCDIIRTGNEEDAVWGAIFSIPSIFVPVLDQYEGVPFCIYERKYVTVNTEHGNRQVLTYIGVNGRRWHKPDILPFDWYKRHVVVGANQLGLPEEYQKFLQAQPSQPDYLVQRFDSEARFWQ